MFLENTVYEEKNYWLTPMSNGGYKVVYMSWPETYDRVKYSGLPSVKLQGPITGLGLESLRKLLRIYTDQ